MKKVTPILVVAAAVGMTVMVVMSRCSGYQPSGPAHLLKASDLTPAQIKVGRSPKRDHSVVYQPDVVVMENGTEAIRSLTPDGLGCVLDADARNVSDLVIGKIAFITDLCVGRIVSTKRENNALTVVLAPVQITDIFDRLDVAVNQPIDLDDGIKYPPPQIPGATTPLDGDNAILPDWASLHTPSTSWTEGMPFKDSSPSLRTVAYNDPPRAPGILPPVFKLQMQTLTPLKNKDGVGMEFRGAKYGLRAVVQAQIRVSKPSLEFNLHIDHGYVEAKLILHNAAGLRLAFDTAVDEGGPRKFSWYYPAGSMHFPIGSTVPLTFDLRQDLFLDVEFFSGTSSFSAGSDYDFNADMGFTVKGKEFTLVTPQGLTVRKAIMDNMSGVAIAPRMVSFRHEITATAGLGGAGFTIGPQLILGTRLEVKEGGDTGIVQCKGSTLVLGVKGGVGWTIPRPLARVLSAFLSLIKVKPIKDHDGVYTDWKDWLNRKIEDPRPVCSSAGG